MKLDLTVDVSAMMALYLVRALTEQNIMTRDQSAKVLATTASWLEQVENEFPKAYLSTPELRETSRRAKACATMLREQSFAMPYGAALTLDREAE